MSSTGQITPRSALRHRPIGSSTPDVSPWIKRASRTLTRPLKPQKRIVTRQQHRWIQEPWGSVLSMSMGLTLIFILFSQSVLTWSTTLYDNWVYGTPRTFQIDAAVGHEGNSGSKSHFIAINNQGRVEVIEFPGNDAKHTQIYLGPLLSGPNADLVPVTLRFVPDPSGRINMVVQVQGTSMLFINRNGSFQPASDNVIVADRHE